jgi:hypothetical protein
MRLQWVHLTGTVVLRRRIRENWAVISGLLSGSLSGPSCRLPSMKTSQGIWHQKIGWDHSNINGALHQIALHRTRDFGIMHSTKASIAKETNSR